MTQAVTKPDAETPAEAEAKLLQAVLAVNTLTEAKAFLVDLLTPSEIKALIERWQVARLLDGTDMSYRDIAQAAGVSTTTVTRVARFLNNEPHQGYRLVLDRMKDKS